MTSRSRSLDPLLLGARSEGLSDSLVALGADFQLPSACAKIFVKKIHTRKGASLRTSKPVQRQHPAVPSERDVRLQLTPHYFVPVPAYFPFLSPVLHARVGTGKDKK